MSSKIVSWYIARKIRKALGMSREEWRKVMKPFPKWFGILSALVAAIPALKAAYDTGGLTGLVMALMGILGGGGAVLSHSLTGTGGKPQ